MKLDILKLKVVLAKNGMNYNTAAEACGVSRYQFYKYRNHDKLRRSTVEKIAKSLGCAVSEIV